MTRETALPRPGGPGTALGWAWSLVVPLATLATYSLVFAVIFRVAPPDFGNGRAGFFPVAGCCLAVARDSECSRFRRYWMIPDG